MKIKSVVLAMVFTFLFFSQVKAQTTPANTLRSGNWNSTSTWSTGSLPLPGQPVTIQDGHVVTANLSSQVAGITVNNGAELRFSPTSSVTISSTENVVINGRLVAKPSSGSIIHTLRFIGITESDFVGGGMVVLESDVGLWVMGDGQLDLAGTPKTSWTRVAGAVGFAATQVTLKEVPGGWRVGDRISIAPTEPLTKATWAFDSFENRTITAINGAVITLNAPTTRGHPTNTNPRTGEVVTAEFMNLTRNVRIEGVCNGTASVGNGRSHVFTSSTQPQFVSHAEISCMGPRRINSDGFTSGVTGRYGFHIHMPGDGSRGTVLDGLVLWNIGGHAIAVHRGHGVTILNTITHNTFDDAVWWDPPTCNTCTGNDPKDLFIDRLLVSLVRADPVSRGFRLSGVSMGAGENLTIQRSVVVGVQGNREAAGFGWPENGGHGVWNFCNDNLAHNNRVDGIFVWQNDTLPHVICDFTAYNNGNAGVDHGAYTNIYQYLDIDSWGNKFDFISRALSNGVIREDGYGMAIERLYAPGTFVFLEHNVSSGIPNLIKDCVLGKIVIDERAKEKAGKIDLVGCEKPDGTYLKHSDYDFTYAKAGTVIRQQNADGSTYQYTKAGQSTIAAFYHYTPSLSPLAQQVKDILDANPEVRQELIDAGVIQ